LLAYYFQKIKGPNREEVFDYEELGKHLQSIFVKLLEWFGRNHAKNFKRFMNYLDRIKIANEALSQREFIILNPHQHDPAVVIIKLDVKGYDLGRKYKSKLISSGLWFNEYKYHWIWLIVGFLGGILGALIVNWLSKGD